MEILSKGYYASPQGGGSLCAIAVYDVALEASELTVSALFDLGPLPEKGNTDKLWRFSHVSVGAPEGIDAGTAVRIDVGVTSNSTEYSNFNTPAALNCDLESNAKKLGTKFADENLTVTIRTAPTTPQDGVLRVVLWGWSD